jgi:hypothetical protein
MIVPQRRGTHWHSRCSKSNGIPRKTKDSDAEDERHRYTGCPGETLVPDHGREQRARDQEQRKGRQKKQRRKRRQDPSQGTDEQQANQAQEQQLARPRT